MMVFSFMGLVMMGKKKKLFITVLISVFFVFFYALYPFINGFGCSFKYHTDSLLYSSVGTCSFGVLSTIQVEKRTGNRYKFYAFIGVSKSYMYTINISRKKLPPYNEYIGDASVYMDELYSEMPIRVFRFFKSKKEKDSYILLSNRPVDLVSEAKIKGRLSIFNE